MARSLINEHTIEMKSKQLSIPYENVLAGYVMESFVCLLSESVYGKQFLLRNERAIGIEAYHRQMERKLYYSYCREKPYTKSELSYLLKEVIKWEKETDINWSFSTDETQNGYVVHMVASLDEMRMPLLVVFEWESSEVTSSEYTFHLLMENHKTAVIYTYPSQKQLLEDFCYAMKHLELIADLSVYERMERMIAQSSFEARKLIEKLAGLVDESGIDAKMERFEMLLSYRTYPYMKKKWKSYLKSKKKDGPEWEVVMERIEAFFSPLWKAVVEDSIYLGDWIPELGRYLD